MKKHYDRLIEPYLTNILSHDFRQQGIRLRQPETLLRWLRAYAAAVSTDAGYSEVLDASTAGEGNKPAAKTTIAYREALENLWLLDELTPWIEGERFISGLKLSPKHYLADPAFAVYLLGLDENVLSGGNGWPSRTEMFDAKYGSIIGRLFEALVYLCLNAYASVNNAKLFFAKIPVCTMGLSCCQKLVFKPKKSRYRSVLGLSKARFITNSTFSSISSGGLVTSENRFKYPCKSSLMKPLCEFRNIFIMAWARFTGYSGLSSSNNPFKSFEA